MPAISRLIAVAPPGDVLESLRFAFERDGTEISLHDSADGPDHIAEMLAERDGDQTVRGHDVIIASSQSRARAETLLRELSEVIKAAPVRIPIVYLGNELSVDAGVAAGAHAVLSQPLFLRDVVTATGLVARRRRADLARGDLNDFGGLFYIVRALTRFKRSAVLTVVRGLRRGEIRFFEGQATSAQIGPLHGLSALHHLMLWHVGTFELRFEHVVQRQQIPLATDELLTDVRRFLAEVHETARLLTFVGSYESLEAQVADIVIPSEIREVLDLMDGSRTLPDIVEDSPYRMFETLRIANRLLELKVIRHVAEVASDFGFKMRRRVEEMVLSPNSGIPVVVGGDETGRTVKLNHDHVPESEKPKQSTGKRSIDWADVMPGSPSKDDKIAQVVPAAVAAGEINVADQAGADAASASERDSAAPEGERAAAASGKNSKPRPEKLETFTSAEERDRLFALGEAPVGSKPAAEPDEQPDSAQPDSAQPDSEQPDGEQVASAQSDNDQPAAPADAPTDPAAADAPPPRAGEHFSDDEEAFFQAGRDIESREPPPVENFDDLDDGYQPVSLWQRLFGRRNRRGGRATSTTDASRAASAPNRASAQKSVPVAEKESKAATVDRNPLEKQPGAAKRDAGGKHAAGEKKPAEDTATSASKDAVPDRTSATSEAAGRQAADDAQSTSASSEPSPPRQRRAQTKNGGKKRKQRKKRKKR